MNIGSRIRFFRSTDLVRWIMSLLLLPAATASGIAHAPDRWQCDPNNSVATLTLGSGADTTQIGLARISGQMVFEATDPRDLTITFKLDSNGDAAAELALARLARGSSPTANLWHAKS
jgi:hypothetical protein